MAGYIFSTNQIPMMQLPKAVADRFLPIATGAQIKVILCLFRFENVAMSIEEISKQCNLAQNDVSDAIDFWVKSGLLIKRGSSLVLSGAVTEQPQTLPRYNPETILEHKNADSEFSFLVDEIQRTLGKTLNHSDMSVVTAMYDYLGFSVELVLQIISYCMSNGKTNFRYIEKIAVDWHDRGIDTFEKAEKLIKTLETRARTENAVSVYFGIDNRALSKKEREYIENWTETLGMSLEMIKEAFEVCIDKKSKLSFAYINGILADWFKKGYKYVSDITDAKDDKKPLGSVKSYNTDEVELEIIKRLAGE